MPVAKVGAIRHQNAPLIGRDLVVVEDNLHVKKRWYRRGRFGGRRGGRNFGNCVNQAVNAALTMPESGAPGSQLQQVQDATPVPMPRPGN